MVVLVLSRGRTLCANICRSSFLQASQLVLLRDANSSYAQMSHARVESQCHIQFVMSPSGVLCKE
jgi:hypothetical protein